MSPHRVKLKGFLCYKEEQEVSFDGNATLWMLSGLNGSGKSSIFDAVTYALFGHHRGGGKEAVELINKDSDSLLVEFDFLLEGKAFRANYPELLNWVQSTAAYGFLQAYHEYVRPLSDVERDHFYAEVTLAACLYGASAATSEAVLEMRFNAMADQLERSQILFEFLAIMRSAPILPLPLRLVQPLLIRAAIDLTPGWLRRVVGLTDYGLNALELAVVRQIGAFADRLVLEINPAVQACRRMRLPANYLYVDDNVL